MFNLLKVSVRNTPHFYGDLSKLNYFNGQKEDFIASRVRVCEEKRDCNIYNIATFPSSKIYHILFGRVLSEHV